MSLVPFNFKGDRSCFDPQKFCDETSKDRTWSASGFAREDVAECVLLFFRPFLIDINCRCPVPVAHLSRTRKRDNQDSIEIVQARLSISSVIDMERECGIAPIPWSRCLDETSANEVAVARFKVLATNLPGFCHIVL